jgi:hypothetical protein
MSLISFASKVLVEYRADTSDIKAKIRELSGEEKKLEQQRLAAAEAGNKDIDQKVKKYALWGAGIAATTVAINVASNALDAYAKTSSKATEEVDRFKAAASDAFGGLQNAIAKATLNLLPLLEGLNALTSKLGEAARNPVFVKFLEAQADKDWRDAGGWTGDVVGTAAIGADIQRKAQNARVGNSISDGISQMYRGLDMLSGAFAADAWAAKSSGGKAGGNGPSGSAVAGDLAGSTSNNWLDALGEGVKQSEQERKDAEWAEGWRELDVGSLRDPQFSPDAASDWFAKDKAQLAAAGARESFLEQRFGKLEEWDAYKTAFDTLTGAVTTGLDAWIEGSASAGDAVRAFIGDAVKGIAIQMTVEALKHGAMAIGSLAMYDYAGAATHGKAAAAFGAGAAVAIGLARGLNAGYGGGGAPAVGGGGGSGYTGPNTASGSAGSGERGRDVIVVYGDDFAEDNPHERQLKARRIVHSVTGNSLGRPS